MKYIDGTEKPFGEKRQIDGIYTLNYQTTMNGEDGGYYVDAIFGVWEKRTLDDDYTMYDEHIFVGECPHQDENGKWVTYNEVPNFIRHSFHSLYNHSADGPFIVRVMPEEDYHNIRNKQFELGKKKESEIRELQTQIYRCTFKMYIKGVWHRFKIWRDHHVHFVSYRGEHTYHIGIENWSKEFQFCYWNNYITGDRYICKVTDETVTIWYIWKDGKFFFKKESHKNDHCYSSC